MDAGRRAALMARHGSVFSIPPDAPFLATLAEALLDGRLTPDWPHEGPFWLSDITLYLPTRRAATALSRLIAGRLGASPLLLPDIRPLGGEDPSQEPFLPPYEPIALPPAVNRFKRRLLLAELVEAWLGTQRGATAFSAPGLGGFSGPPNSAEILALADSLATLIDDFAIARVPPTLLADVDDAQLAAQWQANLDFVAFVLDAWPGILSAEGEMDAAARTNHLLERKAASLAAVHGTRPVIVAGSTGSIPATADLIAAIARLPNGAVVLGGLDTGLDATTVETLRNPAANPHGHPQYGLVRLLRRLETGPQAVIALAAPGPRARVLDAALGLPETTAHWERLTRELGPDLERAVAGLSLIRARTPEEEARAIAIAVHEALAATPPRAVAIIAPDQTLARRICAELARFDIALDDAAGTPLLRARVGRLVRQAVSLVANGLAPVDLMALLHDRHVGLGLGRAAVSRAAQWLDLGALRGQRPLPGFDGLRKAVTDNFDKRTAYPALRLQTGEAIAVLALLDALETALAPLAALASEAFSASRFAAALAETLVLLRDTGPDPLPAIEGEAELMAWIETAMAQGPRGPRFSGAALGQALEGLLAGPSVRPPRPEAEDVVLFGRLEARLMQADRVILAGMIESVWPEIADPGPWMSRGMRMAVGLEPPEKLHGLAAHDFLMAAGAPEVIFTHPERSGTAPATPSRLIQRLEAFVGEDLSAQMAARGEHFLAQARRLDATGHPPRPASRPAPNPPPGVRPRALSITEAETLLRSPYDIYARHVLGLRRIDPLGADPDHAERGTLIHAILGDFISEGHDPAAPEAFETIMAMARRDYARLDALPARQALWLRRFETIASEFLAFERHRFHIATRRAEISGRLDMVVGGAEFTLRGRADRIDRTRLGTLEIIDFKTGEPPKPVDMRAFFAPQLPLEARMAAAGAFGPDLARPTEAMGFIKLSHGPEALKSTAFALPKGMALEEMVAETFRRFQTHVEAMLIRGEVPMPARVLPRPGQRFKGDYHHLARTEEWTVLDGEEEE